MAFPVSLVILLTLLASPVAAWLGRRGPRWASLLALWPLTVTVLEVLALRSASLGAVVHDRVRWLPGLSLDLVFRVDGLSGLFTLLITGVGAVIVVYGAHYVEDAARRARLLALLFVFMTAMLGLVTTDNVFALFVFWELTGFSSYLLIGFDHESPSARRAALQALLVTGMGGLGLLAAGALALVAFDTASLSELAARGDEVKAHAFYLALVLTVLLAAFTKSAQFPFHFWLPNAMAAPTPVSAYLHSATMVKAGVYLVARLAPALGGTPTWTALIGGVGALTMLGGAWRALQERDLKLVLAYTTVSSLGQFMMLIALGTEAAVGAGVAYVLAHAGYKGCLFLLAGAVDHATGTRDVGALSGLWRVMPAVAFAGALGAASMAGLPPLLGFMAKEATIAALLDDPVAGVGGLVAFVVASALIGASGLLVGVKPFVGKAVEPAGAHRPPLGLSFAPVLLALVGLLGLASPLVGGPLELAAEAVWGGPLSLDYALWHGFSLPLLVSAVTLGLVVLAYRGRERLARFAWPSSLRSERLYDAALGLLEKVAEKSSPALQDASLVHYVLALVVTTALLIGSALAVVGRVPTPEELSDVQLHEVMIAVLILAAAATAVRARTTMTAVLSLGTAGYGVALTFLLYGAPDLAMTQFAVETLTAVIFVFVFWRLPRSEVRTSRWIKLRDAVISIVFGGLVTVLTIATATHPTSSHLSEFFARTAAPIAHGRNIVNVILVDFRALDTMGEITVLVTASLGVGALLRIAARDRAA